MCFTRQHTVCNVNVHCPKVFISLKTVLRFKCYEWPVWKVPYLFKKKKKVVDIWKKKMDFNEILEYYHFEGVQQGWCHSFEALHQFCHQVAVKTSFDLKWKRWSRVQRQLSPSELWGSSVKMYIWFCFFDVKCLSVCLNTLKVHFTFIVDKMDLMCSWETVFLSLCERKCVWQHGLPKWITAMRIDCLQLITDCKPLIISCIEWRLYEVLLQQVKHFKPNENQTYWIYMCSTCISYWHKRQIKTGADWVLTHDILYCWVSVVRITSFLIASLWDTQRVACKLPPDSMQISVVLACRCLQMPVSEGIISGNQKLTWFPFITTAITIKSCHYSEGCLCLPWKYWHLPVLGKRTPKPNASTGMTMK